MDNRGWIRIIEASISIIIVLSALFLLYHENTPKPVTDLALVGRQILDEAAHNDTLRILILANYSAQENLDAFVKSRIPSRSLTFEARICELNDVCGKSNYTAGEVWAAERIFAAAVIDAGQGAPKKIRLFIWRADS